MGVTSVWAFAALATSMADRAAVAAQNWGFMTMLFPKCEANCLKR